MVAAWVVKPGGKALWGRTGPPGSRAPPPAGLRAQPLSSRADGRSACMCGRS